MGRIVTACVFSITSLIFGLLFAFYEVAGLNRHVSLIWLTVIELFITAGIFLPVPIAIFLNLRDWFKARKQSGAHGGAESNIVLHRPEAAKKGKS